MSGWAGKIYPLTSSFQDKYYTLDVGSAREMQLHNICFDDSLWDALKRADLLQVTPAGS